MFRFWNDGVKLGYFPQVTHSAKKQSPNASVNQNWFNILDVLLPEKGFWYMPVVDGQMVHKWGSYKDVVSANIKNADFTFKGQASSFYLDPNTVENAFVYTMNARKGKKDLYIQYTAGGKLCSNAWDPHMSSTPKVPVQKKEMTDIKNTMDKTNNTKMPGTTVTPGMTLEKQYKFIFE